VSPRTRFVLFALFIGVVVITIILHLLDIPLGWGYSRPLAAFVVMISVLLYVLLGRIADKLRHRKLGDL